MGKIHVMETFIKWGLSVVHFGKIDSIYAIFQVIITINLRMKKKHEFLPWLMCACVWCKFIVTENQAEFIILTELPWTSFPFHLFNLWFNEMVSYIYRINWEHASWRRYSNYNNNSSILFDYNKWPFTSINGNS